MFSNLLQNCAQYRRCVNRLSTLALIAFAPLPIHAASDTATVAAEIVDNITLTNRNGLVFGDVTTTNVAGTVVLSPGGSRQTTGGASINSAASSGPAVFDIEALPNSTFTITLPVVVVLSESTGNNMVVDNFTSFPVTTGLTDPGGQQSLYIGGTLNVEGNQLFGSYSGTMSVTIGYN
jgi:hypothetical protein